MNESGIHECVTESVACRFASDFYWNKMHKVAKICIKNE